MGNLGPMCSFSACMTSKISQLKFGAHKFERVQWSRIKPFENNSWSRAPNISTRLSGGPNFHIARVFNLSIASSKGSNVPLLHQGPNFSFFPSGHLAPLLPHCFIKGFQFSIASSNGPKFSIALSRIPNFLVMSSKWWPLISHHVIKGSQFIIASSRGPHFTIASSKGPKFPKYTICLTYEMYWKFKITVTSAYRDIVQSVSRGVCGGGVKGIRLHYKTTMICFPIHWQPWCAFWQKNDMILQLILLTFS